MTAKEHFKYAFQRVEQRRNNVDKAGMKERERMEAQSRASISIGTFNIFPPKPDTEIANFTLALSKSVPKHELYMRLKEAFLDNWDGEPTRSIYVKLTKPMPLQILRQKLKICFEDVLSPDALGTEGETQVKA